MTTTNDWRGVAAEDNDDIPDKVSLVLRERSRRLLGSCCARTAGAVAGCWSRS